MLKENIKAIKSQVCRLVIVDNCSRNREGIADIIDKESIDRIFLKDNMGIAYAQNKGMSYLKSLGMKWGVT